MTPVLKLLYKTKEHIKIKDKSRFAAQIKLKLGIIKGARSLY
jgi:hypothetical protein